MTKQSTSILILKLGAIGDTVMSLPLIPALKKRYPSVQLTWVCGSVVAPLIRATGLVDTVIEVNEEHLFKSGMVSRFKALLGLWGGLFLKKFDLILLLHPDPRYRLMTLFTRGKECRSFGRCKGRYHPLPGRYHVYEYLALLEKSEGPLTLSYTFPSLFVSLTKEHVLELDALKNAPLLVICPGGAKNILANDPLRRWPIEHYRRLVDLLNSHSLTPLILGGKEDGWVLPYFQSLSFRNWIGRLDLLETVALLKQARLLITHDSGPLHLGKLVECPTLALFGPTNPMEKVGLSEKIEVLWGGASLACRPCYNGKTYAKCVNQKCLASLTPELVCDKILSYIDPLKAP